MVAKERRTPYQSSRGCNDFITAGQRKKKEWGEGGEEEDSGWWLVSRFDTSPPKGRKKGWSVFCSALSTKEEELLTHLSWRSPF